MRTAALVSVLIAAAWAAQPALAQKPSKVEALTIKQGTFTSPPPQPGFSNEPRPSPSNSRVHDPVARQLNRALALAGALRREVAEGRGEGERASALRHELRHTLQGARAEPGVPEVLAQLEPQPALTIGSAQYQGLQDRMKREDRAYSMISELLRKRHDTAKNAIQNQK